MNALLATWCTEITKNHATLISIGKLLKSRRSRPTIPPSNKALCAFFYGNTPHDENHNWKFRCGKFEEANNQTRLPKSYGSY